jgi:hypothetical protein
MAITAIWKVPFFCIAADENAVEKRDGQITIIKK